MKDNLDILIKSYSQQASSYFKKNKTNIKKYNSIIKGFCEPQWHFALNNNMDLELYCDEKHLKRKLYLSESDKFLMTYIYLFLYSVASNVSIEFFDCFYDRMDEQVVFLIKQKLKNFYACPSF